MIKEIKFINWKSFKESVLYIDPLTVLIGTNASGKSNIIDGLSFLNGVAQGKNIDVILNGEGGVDGIRGGSIFASMMGCHNFTLESIINKDNGSDYRYSITVSTVSRTEIVAESLVLITYTRKSEKKETNIFNANVEDAHAPIIQAYVKTNRGRTRRIDLKRSVSVLSQLRNSDAIIEVEKSIEQVIKILEEIFILDPVPSLMRDYKPLSNNLSRNASNIAGVIAALPKEEKEIIENQLTNYIVKLPEGEITKVWAETVDKFKKDAMLYCEEKWIYGNNLNEMNAKGLSDGTLRILGILTALLTRPEGSLIVIEEVDNGLHPSRAKLLLKILNEVGEIRSIDILITTHNPALMDELGIEMIPFIQVVHRSREDGTSKITLLEDIKSLPKLLAHGSIGELSIKGEIEKSLLLDGGETNEP
ncbi:MAG: ATP-binding protein [Ruminiclostridium sp.]|nr:ATP-binding protein [Ruminiclostridium sp.]